MTRSIGRVSHVERQLHWVWDPEARSYVERADDAAPNELEQIGQQMRAIDREQTGLVQAVRYARARGFTWARIAAILGVSRQAAQQRFGAVDQELRSEGAELPDDAMPAEQQLGIEAVKIPTSRPPRHLAPLPAMQPEPAVEPVAAAEIPQPQYDFSAMNAMTTEELIDLANKLPKDAKLFDPYLLAQREAIVVTLYKRDMGQRKIAALIGKSPQRVSQIIAVYYDRIEKAWARERAQWQKET